MYYLCVCLLHSSLVPVFSGIPSDPNISKKFTKMSAEQVVKHSMTALEMTASFLNLDPDLSRLSAITGYILFVVSDLQFKAIVAQGKQWSQGLSCCYSALKVLQKLKGHILPLQSLVQCSPQLYIYTTNTNSGQSFMAPSPPPKSISTISLRIWDLKTASQP